MNTWQEITTENLLIVQHLKYVYDVPGLPLLGEADVEDMGSVRHQVVTRQVHVGDVLVEWGCEEGENKPTANLYPTL